jgi:hypothetical protein
LTNSEILMFERGKEKENGMNAKGKKGWAE